MIALKGWRLLLGGRETLSGPGQGFRNADTRQRTSVPPASYRLREGII